MSNRDPGSIGDGLWENARDAISHALDHYRELSGSRSGKSHHLKWAALSVHQAAECFCNMLLVQLDPDHQSLKRDGRLWLPSLPKTVRILGTGPLAQHLPQGETRLLLLLKELSPLRNQLMHRTLPSDVEAWVAASSLLGLLRVSRVRITDPSKHLEFNTPQDEADVFSAIPYQRVEEYCRFAEELVQAEFPHRHLGYCGQCATSSIVYGHCEVCFEEVDCVRCPECDEENYIPSWERYAKKTIEVECSSCGHSFAA